ncbi:hypothetical protein CC78DRAFT_539454 [Lojkania enalia]|uniref:Uncharacterized protein n=1 Tax=Lojkania enalia TaxID=147567 RepID=A0A9P4TRB7_9PLEO|nr:hypothetical protein CC78DRAFT_539454 [Didymosphaeria enalia]
MSPQEVRKEMDSRSRYGFYQLARSQGMINMDHNTANTIYTEFISARKQQDTKDTVLGLADKYKLKVADITALALVTFRVPDITDKHDRLPPSQHKQVSHELLLGCVKAKDPLATLHLLSAVNNKDTIAVARNTFNFLTSKDIQLCHGILSEFAEQGNADALTLKGQFLEQEGRKEEAQKLYEKAMTLKDTKYNPANQELLPMAIPVIPPWNAFGSMLLASKDPASRQRAKEVLEIGAFKGDDPLAYYHLASLEDGQTGNWLKFMTKAAASGHAVAMYEIANFYANASSDGKLNPSIPMDSILTKALSWLANWKSGGPLRLAQEWFELAARKGYKPAMIELVDLYEVNGYADMVVAVLENMVEPPAKGKVETWPALVTEARERLPAARARLKASLAKE